MKKSKRVYEIKKHDIYNINKVITGMLKIPVILLLYSY
nr:MAG TPA: hypothetical protein [Caudoviricetes sp.]